MDNNIRITLNSLSIFLLSLAFIFNSCNKAHASECVKPVQVISENQKAQCSGFLFSDKAEKTAAQDRDDAIYYKKLVPQLEQLNKLKTDENTILNKRLELYITESNALIKYKERTENMKFWQQASMFFLGVIVTSAAVNLAR